MKLKLEKRRERLKANLEEVDSILEIIDERLRSVSFSTADEILEAEEPRVEVVAPKEEPRNVELLRVGSDVIASAEILSYRVKMKVHSPFRISLDTRPLRYLIRSLDGYVEDDLRMMKQGDLEEGDKLNYSVAEEEGDLRELRVNNYRSDERLKDIMGKARWAIRTVFSETQTAGTHS